MGNPVHGQLALQDGAWHIVAQPHVMLRLKRVFERISKAQIDEVTLSDTVEHARELEWFLGRFPLDVSIPDRVYLEERSANHRTLEKTIADIMSGQYQLTMPFELAVPPRRYQQEAAALAMASGGLLLADDLGLGKTASAICAIVTSRTLPALVVTMTHLPAQWAAEFRKFAPHLRTHIIKGGAPYPLDKGPRGTIVPLPDVVICNYHKLSKWAHVLGQYVKAVVYDEAQELRRETSDKYAGAKHISTKAKLRMGLSATPIYNYGGEIYNVLEAILPGSLGARHEFTREWCSHASMDETKARIRDPKAFGTYLRSQGIMLRRTRKDVGRELPPLQRISHVIEADPNALEQVGANAAELAKTILAKGGAGFDKMKAGQDLSIVLRQATGIAKAPFVAEFVRMVVETGEPVVLFAWHREVYTVLQDKLADLKPAMYTGSESAAQKAEAKRRFMESETDVLVMSLRSGAGLDGLQQRCRTAVFGELDWSPGVHEQCIGRIYRDGVPGLDPVLAYFLLADSGSDPIVADVLGIKTGQIQGMRDPNLEMVEALDLGEHHIKRLAEGFLAQRGIKLPELEPAAEVRA